MILVKLANAVHPAFLAYSGNAKLSPDAKRSEETVNVVQNINVVRGEYCVPCSRYLTFSFLNLLALALFLTFLFHATRRRL